MDYWHGQWVVDEVLSQIPGYDPSYTLEWYNSWSSYEEGWWKAILSKDGEFWLIEGGHMVMSEGNQDPIWDLFLVTEDQAIEIMIDFDETCDDDDGFL